MQIEGEKNLFVVSLMVNSGKSVKIIFWLFPLQKVQVPSVTPHPQKPTLNYGLLLPSTVKLYYYYSRWRLVSYKIPADFIKSSSMNGNKITFVITNKFYF